MQISELTHDELCRNFIDYLTGNIVLDAAKKMHNSMPFPKGIKVHEDMIFEVANKWLCDTSVENQEHALSLIPNARTEMCSPDLLEVCIAKGVNPYAVYALSLELNCSITLESPPTKDSFYDNDEVVSFFKSVNTDLWIKIAPGVFWANDLIVVNSRQVPETLRLALVGRKAECIIDFAPLIGRRIESAEEIGSRVQFNLSPTPKVSWEQSFSLKI